jgi:hypothetical protein
MAEFKLGRIRFIWKGDWSLSTVYYKDDIVRNGGNTYVCIAGHTAPALFTTNESIYWNKISDGIEWKNNWVSDTYYKVNDIVKYGGYLYIANAAHTSGDTANGLEINDGVILTVGTLSAADASRTAGTYTGLVPTTSGVGIGIEVTAVVNGSGAVAITITKGGNQSVIGDNLTLTDAQLGSGGGAAFTFAVATITDNWDLFAEGFDYKADWTVGTRYKVNDIAKYNGTVYICTLGHTSAASLTLGLEPDQAKWDIFSEGFYWTDVWTINTRYRVNDIVRYGGTLYVANTGHTSNATLANGLEADQSKWDYLHKGIEYRADHAINTRYRINDVVKYGGGTWICTTQHTSGAVNLAADAANWAQFTEGLEFEDSWDSVRAYQPGDFVTYGGYSYVSVTNNAGLKPSDNDVDWDLFTTGFRFIGDYEDDSATREFIEGDVIRLGGFTYLCILKHSSQRPPNTTYWERLNEGIEWKNLWIDATYYDEGDSVKHGVNSYICVLAHTSDEITLTNRPDQDTDGTNWNLLTAGAESGNLTTQGDIVYYGGAGAVRLPIGTPGQVLKVNDAANAPEWTSFGAINNIFYVEPTAGLDNPAPSYGVTIDRPWKSVRYATEQVQYGAIRYNARNLLERNRSFIQDEVVEYIEATYSDTATATTASTDAITVTSTSWLAPNVAIKFAGTTFGNIVAGTEYFVKTILNATTFTVSETNGGALFALADGTGTSAVSLSYVQATCRRDAGQVLDAVIWDLSHGGNERSVDAAKSYFNAAGNTYIGGVNASPAATAAGLTYIITLADAVMSNLAPTTVRGSLNRYTNAVFIEEADALTTVTSLIGIVTSALAAGSTVSVPAQVKPQHSIFVKTGVCNEVLPIIVPANTAIIGDELRSTRISPAGVLTAAADTPKSLDAYARMAVIMSDIVTNSAVTKTTGNALTQVTTSPAGSTAAGTFAAELWTQIKDYADFGVNGASSDSTVPVTYGTNTPNTTTDYTYAVEAIEANRAFLQAEANAYIADAYPSYTYDSVACARDISRYIDAIKYDLIYTGNYKSLLYARYYSNSVSGSATEDMFYMRNGTGLRNCSLSGLSGSLGADNSYGTKRPSAGAFVSLDPGWGPAHTDAWIINKSPYVQNVSNFGTGCIGCKVDGDLHDGGNDSIVANDFTQIISDGIGVWVTNLGRAELVSVFSYYGHIGYLAENGGKVRATNGNSSYGTYGTVAEGVDITEVPITGTVTNQTFDAIVNNVFTDGNNVLALEYSNAGVNYTTSTSALLTITNNSAANSLRTKGTYYNVVGASDGPGTGQSFDIIVDDQGLPTVVINKGGTGHVIGNIITIADNLLGGGGAPAYTFDVLTIGDATNFVVTGEGFGAAVDNAVISNGAVYEVRLTDPSENKGGTGYLDAQNVAQEGTATQITLSNTDGRLSSQYVGMAIYLTSGVGAGQYGYIDTYNNGTKVATIKKCSDDSAGWDHITGVAILAALNDTTNYSIEPRLSFASPPDNLYASTAKGRAYVSDGSISVITMWDPGTGYSSAPVMTVTDPNNTVEVPHTVRIGNGVLAQPTWTNRGTGFVTASADITGDGYADLFQPGTLVRVTNLSASPKPGSNIELAGIPGKYFKLVNVRDLTGTGPFDAQLQISPAITVTEAVAHNNAATLRIRYSQVRLTGHDFLDIGTGNFANTNYPGTPVTPAVPTYETVTGGGGRVFYTTTDQDGNFRVGGLFNVEQSTGTATLNADAFNISGLQELSLGAVELGGTGATITEFSVDGTFTANSDNVVPTQKAIKTYIASQIGGGAGELNVNSITAGSILITGQQISTTTGNQINIVQKVNYTGGISGSPVAMNYFLQQ